MKIALYCQYVLGIGHFFRSLEICRALKGHDVILITGGARVETPLPAHVREFRLPALMMDADFSAVLPAEEDRSVDRIKEERRQRLYELFAAEAPDVFMVELYPFGRKAFRFELDPILEAIRRQELPPCRVICSLRDILVEKKDPAAYENRVIRLLNRYFDMLLVHSDPTLMKLDETFARMEEISVPVVYTGFVTPKPAPAAGLAIRRQLGVTENDRLIVASAGGGKVGLPLLEAVVDAFDLMKSGNGDRLYVFTGPFMAQSDFDRLEKHASDRINILRFTSDFLSYLAAADLSISMAGYNTCMNILASGVRALVWPFMQNREQRLRAVQLARRGALQILDSDDLEPSRMAARICRILSEKTIAPIRIDLNGAAATAASLERRDCRERRC